MAVGPNLGPTGDPKGFREKDLAQLLDLARERLPGPMIMIWDNSAQHMMKDGM